MDFGNVPEESARLVFDGNTDSFVFNTAAAGPFSGFAFRINGSDSVIADAVGLLGRIEGTFTIGPVMPFPGGEIADVTSSPGARIRIQDGNGLWWEGEVDWVELITIGTGGFLNISGTINVTAVTYSGVNSDLLALKGGANTASAILAFTFNPAQSITQLKADGNVQRTSYEGDLVSEPCTGQIGNYVWQDTDGDGCQDANELGIAGVLVQLFAGCNQGGSSIRSTNTDASGKYLFTDLCPGGYTVSFTTPAGYTRTVANQGCVDNNLPPNQNHLDSKCNCAAGPLCGVCVTLGPNEVNLNVDCGYVPALTLNCAPNATGQVGVPYSSGLVVAGGCAPYTFAIIGGSLPPGLTLNPNTGVISGTPTSAGVFPYVAQVTDCGGRIADTSGQSCSITTTCTGQIGNFVWHDQDGDGCQDASEPGLADVKVELFLGDCGTAGNKIGEVITTGTGAYLFSGLCPGNYQVKFTPPAGYTATLPLQNCTLNGGDPTSNQTDSKCNCVGGGPCTVCVTLTPASLVNLNIDCGYIQQTPDLKLFKSADKAFVLPGGVVTYTYVVQNTGGIPINNITVVDDNGTPGVPGDDFTVCTIPTLAAGASQQCQVMKTLPQTLCATINGQEVFAGTLTTEILPSGDIKVTYVQSEGLNDNRYGSGATAATGWSGGHTFGNLTGSDEAQFRFTDVNGNVVLDFHMDYISAAASKVFPSGTALYPSGFGTLGANGGDGGMVFGNVAHVLFATTSLTTNLQLSQFQSGFTVNSPPETSPNSGVSIPAGWDYKNSYTVVVSKNAFGGSAANFGSVKIVGVHDSPPKIGRNLVTPTNCNSCVVNIAKATGTAGAITLMASATATVCIGTPPPPSLSITKVADKTTIAPGESVTYTYTVMNTGGQTINNIVVTDDNGTPGNTADDVMVGAIPSLAPNASVQLTYTTTLQPVVPVPMCMTINGQKVVVGTLATTVLPSGDIQVTYVQENVNDNRYGTGANAATGWPGGHTFNNLVGSDGAQFQFFTLANPNVPVLDIEVDYISASAAFPSGYGSLGVTGGEGDVHVGNPAWVVSATTSLSGNLNTPGFGGFTVNSPPETAPNSGVSVPAGWNYKNSYTVVISKNAFGGNAANFGSVKVVGVHNSPPKLNIGNLTVPEPCNCVVNIANVTGTAAISGTTVSATASAQVCFGTPAGSQGCNIQKIESKTDKKKLMVKLKNLGSVDILVSDLTISWPQGVNGNLVKVKLNGDVFAGSASSPQALTVANFHADPNRRKITPGQTKTLELEFVNNASPVLGNYSGTVKFGTGASCTVTLP